MQKINSAIVLRNNILHLEARQAEEAIKVEEQFYVVYENLKPVNVIKGALKNAFASGTVKHTIIDTSIAIAAGFLSRKLFVNVSHNPLRKILGTALQFGITKAVAGNAEPLKGLAKRFIGGMIHLFRSRVNGAKSTKAE